MDLTKAVLLAASKKRVNDIVRYVENDPQKFEKLVTIYLKGPYRITQRAAWPISYCVEHHPKLVIPHLGKILRQTKKPDAIDAVKRNTMRLLQFIDIPKKYQGEIAVLCFRYLENKKEAVAIKAFAMTVLSKIAEVQPELRNELKIVLEDQLPYAKPAFISRARKILKLK